MQGLYNPSPNNNNMNGININNNMSGININNNNPPISKPNRLSHTKSQDNLTKYYSQSCIDSSLTD